MTEGITAITSRIAAIQADLSSLGTRFGSTATSSSGVSFAQALAAQTGSLTTSTDAAAVAAPSAGLGAVDTTRNADGVPAALAAYGNGKIPASALQQVGDTGHRLWAPAATALTSLIADAKAQGVTIGITDSYRSYEAQVDVAARKPADVDRRVERVVRMQDRPAEAARPIAEPRRAGLFRRIGVFLGL